MASGSLTINPNPLASPDNADVCKADHRPVQICANPSGGTPGYQMPAYDNIPSDDRWHIVNYVRYLQRGGQP